MGDCGYFVLLEHPVSSWGFSSWGEEYSAPLAMCLAQVALSCVHFTVLGMMGVCLHTHVYVPKLGGGVSVCAQVPMCLCPCVSVCATVSKNGWAMYQMPPPNFSLLTV